MADWFIANIKRFIDFEVVYRVSELYTVGYAYEMFSDFSFIHAVYLSRAGTKQTF